MNLVAIVTLWVLSLGQPGKVRAEEIARSIVAASHTREQAALLVVTNYRESSFAKDLETCARLHDHGAGFTAYGLHRKAMLGYEPEQVCADPALAARLALKALQYGSTPRERIAAFLGRRADDAEVSRRVELYERLVGDGQ